MLGVALSACAARTGPALGPVPIEANVFQDNAGGIRTKSERVIRDAATWQQVWQEATSAQATRPPLPEVDFTRQMLLLVSTGRMSVVDGVNVDSVGARVEVADGGRKQEVLAVYYSVVRGCPASTREAYPVRIVRVRRFQDNVRFISATVPGPGCR
jgi:hypothetical protein